MFVLFVVVMTMAGVFLASLSSDGLWLFLVAVVVFHLWHLWKYGRWMV